MRPMEIGVLFHGAQVFYSGVAKKLLDMLGELGSVRGVVTGPISKTICLESMPHYRIKFSDRMPSRLIKDIEDEVDLIILATYSKSPQSGYAYGWMIIEKSYTSKPILQIEISNNTMVKWRNCDEVAELLSRELGCNIIEPPTKPEKLVWRDGNRVYRKVLAVRPGELILINGLVVGRVRQDDVIIVSENGKITELIGVDVKNQALEKLVRRYPALDPVSMKIYSFDVLYEKILSKPVPLPKEGSGTAYVDHSGYEVYAIASSCEGAVSIGDDTTLITSDILARFKRPVLGVVDLDFDCIINNVNVLQESEIIVTKNDDKAGELIFNEIFKRKNYADLRFKEVKKRVSRLIKVNNLLVKKASLIRILKEMGFSITDMSA